MTRTTPPTEFTQQPGPGINPCRCDTPDAMTCGHCQQQWCARCNPTPAARCPYETEHVPDPLDELPVELRRRLATADHLMCLLRNEEPVSYVLTEVLRPLTDDEARLAHLVGDAWSYGATCAWRRLAPEWAAEDARLHLAVALANGDELTVTEQADGSYLVWVSEDSDGSAQVPLTRDHLADLTRQLTGHLATKED